MATRKTQGMIIGVLWLVYLAALVLVIVMYNDTPLSRGHGFPHMPLYGAVVWWFFFFIPLLGSTWGYFNDWREPDARYERP